MREFSRKRRNTFGLDNLITKLLKKGMSKRTHGVAYRIVCKPNERRDRLFGLKLVTCVLVNGGYFAHQMRC